MVEDTIPWEEVFVSLAFSLFLFPLPVYHSLYVTDRRKEKNGDFLFAPLLVYDDMYETAVLRASMVRGLEAGLRLSMTPFSIWTLVRGLSGAGNIRVFDVLCFSLGTTWTTGGGERRVDAGRGRGLRRDREGLRFLSRMACHCLCYSFDSIGGRRRQEREEWGVCLASVGACLTWY
jgi:hypothetical protein